LSRNIKFSLGGVLILVAFLFIGIVILGSFPTLNLGLLINFGGLGLLLGFLGFYMIADALFSEN